MNATKESHGVFNRAGVWFWAAIVIGVALRFYLVVFTQGTRDVEIWERHARDVRERGLMGYYRADESANHPPVISEIEAALLGVSQVTGIPFRVFLRGPIALLDAGSAFFILLLLGKSPWRFVAAAGHWLNPLAIILSAYHGNTDAAVAFILLLSVWFLSREKIIPAAVAAGSIFWVKIPGALAIPALFFFVKTWKQRLIFLVVAGVTAVVTYVPVLLEEPKIIWAQIFGYRGLFLRTSAEVSVWGPVRVVLLSIIAPPERWPEFTHAPIMFYINHGSIIMLAVVLLLTWLRRSVRSTIELCATIAMIYAVAYGMSDTLAFQYFAWSLPFWFFMRPWFTVTASVLTGGYVYTLYWLLCGNPWLLGKWDFFAYAQWPPVIIFFRDAACIFFLFCAFWFVISALWAEAKQFRIPAFPARR